MKNETARSATARRPQRKLILIPIDFSDSSVRALRHAITMVKGSGGSLNIVYVVSADYGLLGIGREEGRDLDRKLQHQAAHRLRVLADSNVPQTVDTTLEVRIGRPAEEIAAAATESKCDLIVMSTHGHSGLDRLLIGSVADRVMRLAPCPVFLVRPGKPLARRKSVRPSVLRFKHAVKRVR